MYPPWVRNVTSSLFLQQTKWKLIQVSFLSVTFENTKVYPILEAKLGFVIFFEAR